MFRAGLATRSVQAEGKALDDLESVQRLFVSQVLFAVFDMPWAPIFAAAIFIFHPWLGWLAVAGGLVLVALALLNQILTRTAMADGVTSGRQAAAFAGAAQRQREAVRGMGMGRAVLGRWQALRGDALRASIGSNDKTGLITAFTRAFRLALHRGLDPPGPGAGAGGAGDRPVAYHAARAKGLGRSVAGAGNHAFGGAAHDAAASARPIGSTEPVGGTAR